MLEVVKHLSEEESCDYDNSKMTIITCKVKAEAVVLKGNYIHTMLDLILSNIYRASASLIVFTIFNLLIVFYIIFSF